MSETPESPPVDEQPEPPANDQKNDPPYDCVVSFRRSGIIEIAIWRKQNDNGFYDYSFTGATRSYKDKTTKQTVRTSTIFADDAAEVTLMQAEVHARIARFKDQDYQERQQQAA